jgi:hypothetical protein
VPITVDGDLLVLTIPGAERHLAGHLETAANRNSILNALELVAGRRLSFRVIDGSTLEEWEALKAAEHKARAAGSSASEQAAAAPSARGALGEGPWDELIQRMHRHYQQLPKRQYPQSKARFIREALGWIARADEDLRYEEGANEDAHERHLARAIERLASIVELPPVIVAIQMDALRRGGEV